MLAAIMLVGSVYSSIAQVLSPDTLLLKQHIEIFCLMIKWKARRYCRRKDGL